MRENPQHTAKKREKSLKPVGDFPLAGDAQTCGRLRRANPSAGKKRRAFRQKSAAGFSAGRAGNPAQHSSVPLRRRAVICVKGEGAPLLRTARLALLDFPEGF